MIIKPLKDQIVLTILLPIIAYAVFFILIASFDPDFSELDAYLIISSPSFVLLLYGGLRNLFAYCRTIIMDKDGCTVKFFGIKKRYLWGELETKSVEYYEMRLCASLPSFYKAVVFSKRKNFHTPEDFHLNPYLFLCFNPFKFFYVGFIKNPNFKNNEVDEQLFMEKMNEWGIELQEYKNGKFSPYKNEAGKIQD